MTASRKGAGRKSEAGPGLDPKFVKVGAERRLRSRPREVSLRVGQERDRLALELRNASATEKVRAYKGLLKKQLKEARTVREEQEIRRRITEDLLVATSSGPWRRFSRYLNQLERLGYSSMDRRLLVCVLAAEASKGSPAGIRKVTALIEAIEGRAARARKLHPSLREEIAGAVVRARAIIGQWGQGHASNAAVGDAPATKPGRANERKSRGKATTHKARGHK